MPSTSASDCGRDVVLFRKLAIQPDLHFLPAAVGVGVDLGEAGPRAQARAGFAREILELRGILAVDIDAEPVLVLRAFLTAEL